VWSSPKSASHITALSVVRPSSRAPSHISPLTLTRAQEWGDTSLSSFDGRTPRASPSRTRGQGLPLPTLLQLSEFKNRSLQLSEFEETPALPLLPNISGVRRQRSHACSLRTQTISDSHSSCPRQRPMSPNHPSTTIDQLAEQHTFLLADLEVDLPPRLPSPPSGNNSKPTSVFFAST
jgi:hypothetical protein